MENKYSKGSEWRKWDLHVHTPKSIVQHYGGDTPEAWEKFITNLEQLPPEFKVIGINDYIFIDGYQKVLEFKEQGRLQNLDLILPVIELRIDKFSSLGDESWKKVNFHIIFSNEISSEIINAQFLNAVQHTIKISPDITGVDFSGVVTRDELTRIGQLIKQSSSVHINETALKVGFSNIVFDLNKIYEIVNGYFKGKCLTAIGKSEWDTMRWEGSAATKKSIINKAHFSFTSLSNAADYNKHISALERSRVRSFLLDCSDSHSFSDRQDKDRIGNSFTWLKADPTFEGLKQVANDRTRIFVGNIPPLLERYRTKKTKFIQTLSIDKVTASNLKETWFDCFEVNLNPSLVAIIGNKGNGKSALADTIGLVGNTSQYNYFSFLSDAKFRNKKKSTNRSESFEATLVWADGTADTRKLSLNPEVGTIEKVKYIPQGYLERLCNEDIEEFEVVLRNVIFSHISESDRLGKSSLDDLINYKTAVLKAEVDTIKKDLIEVNKSIINLERKTNGEFKSLLEERRKEKENELRAHRLLKPIPVDPPSDNLELTEENKILSDQITEVRDSLSLLQDRINEQTSTLSNLKIEFSDLSISRQSLKLLEGQIEVSLKEIASILDKFSLRTEDIVTYNFNLELIDDRLAELTLAIKTCEIELGDKVTNGLYFNQINNTNTLNILQDRLDLNSKKYQLYLNELKAWSDIEISIIGTSDKEDSVAYFISQIEYINDILQIDLQNLIIERDELVKKLFAKKEEEINLYKTLFKPISDFILVYKEALQNYQINIDVDYRIIGLFEKFGDIINFGTKGSFTGNPSGIEKLNSILNSYDISTLEGVIGFLHEVTLNLHTDYRDNSKREVEKQLKKGYSELDLYSLLYGLDYLEPKFKLMLGEKDLAQLSPGERGALLLIFFLTLDQSDIPLVIDQPEENLDNQSVFKILVRFISEAKNKRQIIIVTHNPNLAVACGAEQIIFVSINKANNNTVSHISGSLEFKEINDTVINILEGTYPALNIRTSTYGIINREL